MAPAKVHPTSARCMALENTGTATSTPIYRNINALHALSERPAPGINTLHDLCEAAFARAANRPLIGYRTLKNTILENVKTVKKPLSGGSGKKKDATKRQKYLELGPYEWLTGLQVQEITSAYSSGLKNLGLNCGDAICVFAETIIACFRVSIALNTSYATLGEAGLQHALNESEISTIFTDIDLLPIIFSIRKEVSTLKTVIYSGSLDERLAIQLKSENEKLLIISIAELLSLGKQTPHQPQPPGPDDTALIVHTSGSAGDPKGVILTHRNIVAGVSGGLNKIQSYFKNPSQETYMAYLPLAHALEFQAEFTLLYMGMKIGFASIRTLSDASVRNCKGDLQELQPTFVSGVPAVWEGFRKAIETNICESSKLNRAVFKAAFNLKWFLLCKGWNALVKPLDALVFCKIQRKVCGSLKFGYSGGAALSKHTQKFINVCLTRLVCGYGMTESSGGMVLQEYHNSCVLGNVGVLLTCFEMKLVDVPDMGYLAVNKPRPQGEIWFRGPAVTKGYYKLDKLTKETITEDGWLMSGDIGEICEDGTFAIIDRKKNIVKLSHGEYISLEKLESNYKLSKYVQNICVCADSEQSFAIALIQPVELEIRALAAEIGLFLLAVQGDLCELYGKAAIRNEVLNSLKEVAKSLNFMPAEVIRHIYLTHEDWTPQNGLLTAAMKLKRSAINIKYKNEIAEMYKA